MAFYQEFNLISIHCPRTGGTAIHVALGQSMPPHNTHDHWQHIRKSFPDVWGTAFKFATVRNPFDWLVSLYNHPSGRSYRSEAPCPERGQPINISPMGPRRSFEDYVRCPTLFAHESPFITQSETIGPDIDFIVRFENLQEDFDTLCDHIGRPTTKLPLIGPTLGRDKDYNRYYTPELIQSVNNMFYEDLKRFNYSYKNYWNALCNKYNYSNKKEISND